jgi:uncharacterized membrane protein/glutaredoxin
MAQSYRTNLSTIAAHFVQHLKIPVTNTTLKQTLEQNPYYPSLYSLSNTFDKLNIENAALEVGEENLHSLQPPFAAYLSGQSTGKDFVLVTAINEANISYYAEGYKPKTVTKEQFLKQWQKVVLVAEANALSGEPDYTAKFKIEKTKTLRGNFLYAGFALLAALVIFHFTYNSGSIIAAATFTLIKLLGIAVTVPLLIYDIDKTNSFVKNICTAGKQSNCDAVLNSNAAKILGMGWAEVGFFYFATTTLFLLLPGIAFAGKIPWLAITNAAAAPYIVFSIYYQWKVVKQWCPLCLAVQALLALELVWSIINYWIPAIKNNEIFTESFMLIPDATGIMGALFCTLLPMISWYLLKPLFLAAKNAPLFENAYKRLLYNPDTFNALLQQQPTAPDGWQQLGIDIGNPNAANTVIKICNPYCGPCAKAHLVLEEIIRHNKNVKVKVIFTATNNENDRASKPIKHLLAIAAKGNLQLSEKALDDWYMADKKDYELFAAKYLMNGELKLQEAKLESMSKWCENAEIRATPTIFINGKRLPETYSINELKNIF